MKIILCGHTGSINRGCDAIIKSTADMFHTVDHNIHVCLVTNRKSEDIRFGFEEYDEIIETAGFENSPIKRGTSIIIKKMGKPMLSYHIRYGEFEKNIDDNTVVLIVGGDTYCYDNHVSELYKYVIRICKKRKVPCVLWACSVERDRLQEDEFIRHFKEYDLIFARENSTYSYFMDAGFHNDKVLLMSDPAFSLVPQSVELPYIFESKKVVGINLSHVVFNWSDNKELLLQQIYDVIDFFLKKEEVSIALIPHVYSAGKESYFDHLFYGSKREYDTEILRKVKEHYKNNKKVFLFTKFYNSKQLKYIISKLSFLITARTHASIAGYSSGIPTIVIGYSIKAIGLADAIFGTHDKYVISNRIEQQTMNLLEASKFCISNLDEIIAQEKGALKNANQQIRNAVNRVIQLISQNS